MASITEGVAYLTAGVRTLVRDAIATVVSRAIEYAGEEVLSLGLATPWVIEQVSTLVAAWSARIGRLVAALKNSIARLIPLMRRLGDLIDRLAQLLHDMHGTDGNPTKVGRPTGERRAGLGATGRRARQPRPGHDPLQPALGDRHRGDHRQHALGRMGRSTDRRRTHARTVT